MNKDSVFVKNFETELSSLNLEFGNNYDSNFLFDLSIAAGAVKNHRYCGGHFFRQPNIQITLPKNTYKVQKAFSENTPKNLRSP